VKWLFLLAILLSLVATSEVSAQKIAGPILQLQDDGSYAPLRDASGGLIYTSDTEYRLNADGSMSGDVARKFKRDLRAKGEFAQARAVRRHQRKHRGNQ
jgi:hypothetical protein